ncbi:MAG: type 1 glutamine amidotransferase domain-containing protein [Chloroflexota bacterium]|nr:type 1 glutamine amidotransferase domain-containing protein [Chloroflexota bacterium]
MSGELSEKKVAIIVAQEFEDIELLFPLLRLSEEGIDIVVVPVQAGHHPRPAFDEKPVTGRFGHTVPIPVMTEGKRYSVGSIEDLSVEEVDCLFFPGGYSPDALRQHEGTLELVREFYQRDKLLATICHAPWILISAGIMKGKRATGYAAVRDDLVNAGAEYIDAPVVRDGNIITSRVPDDLPQFCQEIIEALSPVPAPCRDKLASVQANEQAGDR